MEADIYRWWISCLKYFSWYDCLRRNDRDLKSKWLHINKPSTFLIRNCRQYTIQELNLYYTCTFYTQYKIFTYTTLVHSIHNTRTLNILHLYIQYTIQELYIYYTLVHSIHNTRSLLILHLYIQYTIQELYIYYTCTFYTQYKNFTYTILLVHSIHNSRTLHILHMYIQYTTQELYIYCTCTFYAQYKNFTNTTLLKSKCSLHCTLLC